MPCVFSFCAFISLCRCMSLASLNSHSCLFPNHSYRFPILIQLSPFVITAPSICYTLSLLLFISQSCLSPSRFPLIPSCLLLRLYSAALSVFLYLEYFHFIAALSDFCYVHKYIFVHRVLRWICFLGS